MSFEKLQKFLQSERLTIEESIEAQDILIELSNQLGNIETYVKEPDDIDESVVHLWTREQLEGLREAAVVAIANELGIDASIRDRKNDTIMAILDFQKG